MLMLLSSNVISMYQSTPEGMYHVEIESITRVSDQLICFS
jgi:hypothetical protein